MREKVRQGVAALTALVIAGTLTACGEPAEQRPPQSVVELLTRGDEPGEAIGERAFAWVTLGIPAEDDPRRDERRHEFLDIVEELSGDRLRLTVSEYAFDPEIGDDVRCDRSRIAEIAGEELEAVGHQPGDLDYVIVEVPDPDDRCQGGLANSRRPLYAVVWDWLYVGNPVHEFLHQLGLGHAYVVSCVDGSRPVTLGGSCVAEPDDPDSLMGAGEPRELPLAQAVKLGWVAPGRVEHLASSGNETLSCGGAGAGLVLVELSSELELALEAACDGHSPTGVRIGLSGNRDLVLLDAMPATEGWSDAPFAPGSEFTAPGGAVSVRVGQVDPGCLKVEVELRAGRPLPDAGLAPPEPSR